jgi:peptide chain release factor 1
MKCRHDEILTLLQNGGDQTSLGKELSSLSSISGLCDEVARIHDERVSLEELLIETKQSGDVELIEEIREELSRLNDELDPLSMKMLHSLVPMLNPDDITDLTSADAVIDIRAGTGGDEAALFASEILAGYEAVAKRGGAEDGGGGGKAWDVEVLSVSRTDLGGVKEASLAVSSRGGGGGGYGGGGFDNYDSSSLDTNDPEAQTQQLIQQLGPYGFFQYESGVHRVQRVPINDNKLQTSAVSVAVLPSLTDSQVNATLPPTELKIETMRASGAGGQHVNTTESAVRVTHIPTGVMAYMQEERSQHKNKSKALKLVAARVYQLRKEEALKNRSAARSSLMGGGDRSERIRTYNFPQDRITDHRCKVSVTGVGSWLGGGGMVRKFGPYLYQMEREERVLAMEEEDDSAVGGGGESKKHKK